MRLDLIFIGHSLILDAMPYGVPFFGTRMAYRERKQAFFLLMPGRFEVINTRGAPY